MSDHDAETADHDPEIGDHVPETAVITMPKWVITMPKSVFTMARYPHLAAPTATGRFSGVHHWPVLGVHRGAATCRQGCASKGTADEHRLYEPWPSSQRTV
jgi:hypothetical protein